MNLPNVLTLGRIALVPVFALLYAFADAYYLAAALFAAAALTDWLDGYLARRLGQTTPFGTFLDPVADKLIVVVALVLLIGGYADLWLTIPGVVIVGREIVISALREWMAEMNRRGLVAVSALARIKTGAQMAAIAMLLAAPPTLAQPLAIAGLALLYGAAALTIYSMVVYLRAAWPSLRDGLFEEPRRH